MFAVDLTPVRLTLASPFAISHGTYAYRDTLIVRLSRDGVSGYGEAPVVPYYNITLESAQAQAQSLRSWVLAELEDVLRPGSGRRSERDDPLLRERVLKIAARVEAGGTTPGDTEPGLHAPDIPRATATAHPFVRSAFSEAILDWLARRESVRTSALFALPTSTAACSSYTIAERDPDLARDLALQAVAAGSSPLPLKIKCGYSGDAETVAAVRGALPDAELWIDCNGGWSSGDAPRRARAMEAAGVTLIEEPVAHDFAALEEVASAVTIPVIADESVTSLGDLAAMKEQAPAASGAVLKVAKLGGPMAFVAAREWLSKRGMRCMVGEMVESAVGTAWALSLAAGAPWVDLDAPVLVSGQPPMGLVAAPGHIRVVGPVGTGIGDTEVDYKEVDGDE